jgi:hypothetical protein
MGPILIRVLLFNTYDHCKADICTSKSEKSKFCKMCPGGYRRSRLNIQLGGSLWTIKMWRTLSVTNLGHGIFRFSIFYNNYEHKHISWFLEKQMSQYNMWIKICRFYFSFVEDLKSGLPKVQWVPQSFEVGQPKQNKKKIHEQEKINAYDILTWKLPEGVIL